ncbi:hypothetical protein Taro_029957 [Colocasia esculenta]|uniref:Uncharacterized protein n=1 Tax=Colocasia esculenta TaxID=4460 RepID=A0A843VL72_COLES|nr:hypothetical protein [Colocasia esculenta]
MALEALQPDQLALLALPLLVLLLLLEQLFRLILDPPEWEHPPSQSPPEQLGALAQLEHLPLVHQCGLMPQPLQQRCH